MKLETLKPGMPKWLTCLSLIGVILFLMWLGYAVCIEHMPVKNTMWALAPPVIAIMLALITKEVYSSLFLGILTGALLNADFDPIGGLNRLFPDGIMAMLADKWNVGILVFLVILGTMVQLMNRTGGSAAFGSWAANRIKSREGAQLSTMLLGCLIFIDDYFNCLTVGSVMRPVTDKHQISRAKLAYLIDSTAAPICIIAPISSWAAAVSGFVKGENGISIFVQSIPFNFYALLTMLMMVFIICMKIDYGSMLLHENNACQGDLFTSGKRQQPSEASQEEGKVGQVTDMLIPVILLVVGCVIGMIYTGGFFHGKSFVDAFAASNASVGLVMGSAVALLVTIAFFVRRLHGVPARGVQADGSRHADPDVCMDTEEHDRQSGSCHLCGRAVRALCRRAHGLPTCNHLCRGRRTGICLRHIVGHIWHTHPHRGFIIPERRSPAHDHLYLGLHGRSRVWRPLLSYLRHLHHVVGWCTMQSLEPRHHPTALCADSCCCVVLHLPCGWLHKECSHLPRLRYCYTVPRPDNHQKD